MPGTVLVTVGTTKFDALVEAVDSPPLAEALLARGYSRLIIQLGAGAYLPRRLVPNGTAALGQATTICGLHVAYFDFTASLKQHMQQATLVISHAGSGSIFEALQLGKPLIAVPNTKLMANHQVRASQGRSSAMWLLLTKTIAPDVGLQLNSACC